MSREVKQIDQVFVEAEVKLFLSKSGCGHLQDLQTLIRPRGVCKRKPTAPCSLHQKSDTNTEGKRIGILVENLS